MGANQALGRYGEDVAARYLTDAGLQVLARNWRTSAGELDIVAREGEVLVFCEVKTRRSVSHGTPLEAITRVKAARLRRLARLWLAADPRDGAPYAEVRFDVVGVLRPLGGAAVVEHVRGAF